MTPYPASEVSLPAHQGGAPAHLVLRPFRSADDYARCEAVQRITWGQDFTGVMERGNA